MCHYAPHWGIIITHAWGTLRGHAWGTLRGHAWGTPGGHAWGTPGGHAWGTPGGHAWGTDDMYRAMIAKDTTALSRLLADHFVLVHMTGMRQSKTGYLGSIAQGTLNYYSCDDTQLDITVKDDRASLTGRSRVNAAVFGGGRHTWRLQLDIDLKKEGGRWLMTEARASTW